MPTLTPTFTDNVSVVAAATLARNATTSGTIDLRSKRGAWLFIRVGRTGTTALTNGVDVLVRRTLNANAISQPCPVASFRTQYAAAQTTTCATSDSASGQAVVTVASTTSFAAGDYLIFNQGGAREEFARVARVTSSTAFLLDRNLTYTHTSSAADTIYNKADAWTIWIDGGSYIEVVFDYGDDAAGDSVRVECKAQTYDSDTLA